MIFLTWIIQNVILMIFINQQKKYQLLLPRLLPLTKLNTTAIDLVILSADNKNSSFYI